MYDLTNTLFVSDLDGTLLRHDGTLSRFSLETINHLLESGMKISFATARSLYTATLAIGEIDSSIPLILHNGSFIRKKSGEYLAKTIFTESEAGKIRDILDRHSVEPLVYSIHEDNEIYRYDPGRITPEEKKFVDSHPGDPRKFPSPHEKLFEDIGSVFYVISIGSESELRPLLPELADFAVMFQKDVYTKDQWIEILPKGSGKAQAIKKLAETLRCEKIVVFGDAENDLSNFGLADEAYAMANAVDTVKKAATAVIGSNEEDSVAKFLLKAFEESTKS